MKRFLLPLLVHSAFVIPHVSFAAEPPTTPILRIEAGMHTATIKRISTDAAGRQLLTVSYDKTARLWEMPSGRLLRILRPPIGENSEGNLIACALSPDGRLAALGGFTAINGDPGWSVYIFDTANGQMVRRLTGLPTVTFGLAFSAQGRFLAAVCGGGGLRVWEMSTGLEIGSDAEYTQQSYDVHWHDEERLVTACYDGNLRLYEMAGKSLRRSRLVPVDGGKRPYSVRFSPSGRFIAVGFDDSTKVSVVDGRSLAFLFHPDTAGVDHGTLQQVTWTDTGDDLAAAGVWGNEKGNCIRLWPSGGHGRPQDYPAASNTITDLRPLPGGRIAFSAFGPGPVTGVLAPDLPRSTSKLLWLGTTTVADYREGDPNQSHLRLSDNGTEVSFCYESNGRTPALFSINTRKLDVEKEASHSLGRISSLKPPARSGLPITDWGGTKKPKLNGVALLGDYETSRSLAISHDVSSFLLGTEWALHSFTAGGQERWQVPAPGVAWAVNLTDHDRLAVAAYGDGTIRWYDYDTHQELLAFFPHADRKRWVLWTPQGYYDCSAGAEELIGWHVNRGQDHEADFFPAAKFREQFYRPDIIQLVLPNRDVAAAVAQANAAAGLRTASIEDTLRKMAPPVVELTTGGPARTLELAADATEAVLTYRVRNGSTPVSQMLVLVDSRPVEASAPIPSDAKEEVRVTVPLPGRDCVVALLAGNRHAFSEPVLVTIRRKAAPRPSAPAVPKKGVLYVLAVGVSQLRNQAALPDLAKLEYADDDATAFHRALALQTNLYQEIESRVLVDDEAPAGDILDALEWVKNSTRPEDTALILLAGHGESDAQGRYTFCAHDYDRNRRLRTGVGFEDIKLALGATKGEVVLFLDACSAGSSLGAGSKVDVSGLVNQLSDSDSNIVVFASSDGRTPSLESDDLKQGLFTHCVKEGLNGKADLLRNGRITLSALQTYVDDAVRELSKGQQIPVINIPKMVPNLTLGLVP
ncbi:MAG: hypothetical protein ACO1TE_02765 [Prosthecobacter sp.]